MTKDRNIENIDHLFREGLNSEEAQFTIPEGEWEKMEQRLNRYDSKKRGIFWLVRLGSVAALILLFFVLGVLITDRVPPVDEQAMVKQNEQMPTVKKSTSTDSLHDTVKVLEKLQVKNPAKEAWLSEEIKNTQKRPIKTDGKLALESNQQQPIPFQEATDEDISSNQHLPGDTLQKENTIIENAIKEPVAISREQNPPVTETVPSASERSSGKTEPAFSAAEAPIKQPEKERRGPKMALSVMAAPAYNGVNNLNNGSMGGDFGLLVSMEIAPNWKVCTGGIYAKKLYETGFKDYNPKNNIWQEYYPQTVNADCRVLDIPVNLSYTFFNSKGRTISMGTGLSSYIMLREDYRFTYEETDPDTPLSYRVVNENRHWLSVVNLQANIEQRLSKRISISLQPYLKIPLGNIGFAGVKLESLGMAANLNWNFGI